MKLVAKILKIGDKKGISFEEIKRLEDAWNDILKYGEHDGDCTFTEVCNKCKRPEGICEKHKNAINDRVVTMNKIIRELKNASQIK